MHLTCLHIEEYFSIDDACDVREQFQHLKYFTALADLAVSCQPAITQQGFPEIQHPSHLTRLSLKLGNYAVPGLQISSSSIHSWACRTALHSLALAYCHCTAGDVCSSQPAAGAVTGLCDTLG